MADMSIEALKQKANEANNEEHKRVDSKAGLAVDPLQAALDRAEAEKKAEQEADLAAYKELKEKDGREYEWEVEGFNIGDSFMRRARTLDQNAQALADAIQQEDIEEETASEDKEVKDDMDLNSKDEDLDDLLKDDGDIDELDLDIKEDEGEPEMAEVEEKVVAPVVKEEKKKEAAPVKEEKDTAITQDQLAIDDEDLLDLDFSETEEAADEDVSEEDLNLFRDAINEKLGKKAPEVAGGFTVVKKATSLSKALAKIEANTRTVDFPLMSAGKNVTMKAFTGSEIDNLNRGTGGRNRFNTLKEIYKSIYDHITSEKPDFEEWLKVTSFLDLEHLYMAIYKASFEGANYIPLECDDDKCKHVFLSDNIEINDMIKFKNEAAKKRFHDIFENSDKESAVAAKLYATTIVPITDTIAIGFREPSIYNTIFENSVLDDKFIEKYQRLLAMMVYIDSIYLIEDGQAVAIDYKKDEHSVAKTAKYRIATYAKIIQALPSDGYQKIVSTLAEINTLGDSVQYKIPEYTCPKCKHTIPESIRSSQQLLFGRHQLSLLSQQ